MFKERLHLSFLCSLSYVKLRLVLTSAPVFSVPQRVSLKSFKSEFVIDMLRFFIPASRLKNEAFMHLSFHCSFSHVHLRFLLRLTRFPLKSELLILILSEKIFLCQLRVYGH